MLKLRKRWGKRVLEWEYTPEYKILVLKCPYVMQYRVEWIRTNEKVNNSFKMYLDREG